MKSFLSAVLGELMTLHKFYHQQVLEPASVGRGGQPTTGSPLGAGHR